MSRPAAEGGIAGADHPADPVRDAVTVPLAGGEVTVEPARAVVARLRSRGLVVAVADGDRASGGGGPALALALDERSHLLAADGALLGGQLVTAEGIELVAGDGRSRAAVTGLAVDLADGTVTALTGGGGTVVLGTFGRDGSLLVTPEGAVSLGGTVALSTAGAGAVNSAVGRELFSAGEKLGRLAVRAEVVLDESVSGALRVPPEAPPAASGPGPLS
ncbi:hypothetical protein GCM10009716_46340 [Streptomyces sodiiphilus]|uniref:Uncharacterized protein n=1 Tax=Streptomyces sodiiphilus TaxID=226217 RepID=A0ABN2PVT4_9ACTN